MLLHAVREPGPTPRPKVDRFLDVVQAQLAQLAPQRASVALLVAEIDWGRALEDIYGFEGVALLEHEVTRRCGSVLRSRDPFGTIGSSQLGFFVPRIDLITALRLGERLRQAVGREPFEMHFGPADVTVTVGAIVATANSVDAEELIASARVCVNAAKQTGRNCTLARAMPVRKSKPRDNDTEPMLATGS